MPNITGASQSSTTLPCVRTVAEIRERVAEARGQAQSIAFVPTMGALHEGHAELIRQASASYGFVVVSIFVNPTQFGPREDFTRYPRHLDRDLDICLKNGAHCVFHPDVTDIYPPGGMTVVTVPGLADRWEGEFRPGHFQGVTTVVLKLFEIVRPDVAFFGQKDYQQQLLIRRMCCDLHVPVEIRTIPTVREPDGLAMSSRNVYLSATERQTALSLSQTLRHGQSLIEAGERNGRRVQQAMRERLTRDAAVSVDYVELVDPQTLIPVVELASPTVVAIVAARVGTTRLIDNLIIPLR